MNYRIMTSKGGSPKCLGCIPKRFSPRSGQQEKRLRWLLFVLVILVLSLASLMLRILLRKHSSRPLCGLFVDSPTLARRWFSIYNSKMGETVRMGDRPTPVPLPNAEQFFLDSDQGHKYLIQLSWPLHWLDNRTSDRGPLPIIYVVDGNALFLTATEVAWRRAASSHFAGGGLIVAIGYPVAGKLYDAKRRSLDLTPPAESPIPGAGGADAFLDFMENSVRPAVKVRFPKITISREALYGHSYGGLFALHALFTRPHSFDCYIASSPSIWWNRRCILHSAQAFLDNDKVSDEKSPSLVVSWGSCEQNPPQWNDEPLDHYEGRKQIASELRMADNALDLVNMLGGCNRLHTVQTKEYEGEEHTSVMACSISRGLTMFFEDWPLNQS